MREGGRKREVQGIRKRGGGAPWCLSGDGKEV